MPVLPSDAPSREAHSRSEAYAPIEIGIVNKMPDATLRTTERQFRDLLSAASLGLPVGLRLYPLPEVPRADAAHSHIGESYEDINELWSTQLDSLIVTGLEPQTSKLVDEPFCRNWSIGRKDLQFRRSGYVSRPKPPIFISMVLTGTPSQKGSQASSTAVDPRIIAILSQIASQWCIPHSRYNEVKEDALVAKGYRILSPSAAKGVDVFYQANKQLICVLSSAQEYDCVPLLREYGRDSGRFLSRDSYQKMPIGYFDAGATAMLAAFRERALRGADIDLLSNFPL